MSNQHKVNLSNSDLNVVLAGLELLAKSKRHTLHTRQWAEDLHGHLKSVYWNFMPASMQLVMLKD